MYTYFDNKHSFLRAGDTRFWPVLPFAAGVLVAVGLLSARAAFSQPVPPEFGPPWVFDVSAPPYDPKPAYDPYGLALGDIDGDGDLDLAVTCRWYEGETGYMHDYVKVWRNSGWWLGGGTGFHFPPATYELGDPLAWNENPTEAAFADMNVAGHAPDGRLDLVVVLEEYNRVQILINDGGDPPGFLADPAWIYAIEDPPGWPVDLNDGLVVNDWDCDGLNDIAVAGRRQVGQDVYRPMLGLLWSEAAGSFAPAGILLEDEQGGGDDLAAWHDPAGWACPMASGDAWSNMLAMTNEGEPWLDVFTYQGNRVFGTVSYTGIQFSPGITAAKLNADNQTDLAVTDGVNSVWWYKGMGGGVFDLQEEDGYEADGGAYGIACGLLNQFDGRIDLVTANRSGLTAPGLAHGNVTVLANTGDERAGYLFDWYRFLVRPYPEDVPRPAQVVVGDLNGDGMADIITANIGDQYADEFESVSVLLQFPPPFSMGPP